MIVHDSIVFGALYSTNSEFRIILSSLFLYTGAWTQLSPEAQLQKSLSC